MDRWWDEQWVRWSSLVVMLFQKQFEVSEIVFTWHMLEVSWTPHEVFHDD
jgi:hypothetical protein